MNIQSAISKQVFIPRDERLLVAVEVKRRKKKRTFFSSSGRKGDYATFICLSVTNQKPHQLLITKVKQFGGSSSFNRRSQWTIEQLRQINGINPKKDCPEFDLLFDNALDQWVASSAAEKCIFVQVLYHACQSHWEGKVVRRRRMSLGGQGVQANLNEPQPPLGSPRSRTWRDRRKSVVPPRQTEFINCQSKLTGGARSLNLVIYRCKAFFNRMKNAMVAKQARSQSKGHLGQRFPGTMGSVVQMANLVLGQRGDNLSREDKTVELMHKAHLVADAAHKMAMKQSK